MTGPEPRAPPNTPVKADEKNGTGDEDFELHLREIFGQMDSNKNGSLDRAEVSSALRTMGIPTGRGVGSAFMKAVDKNHDDKIEFEEFMAYAKERREKVREVFDELRGKEGTVSTAQLLSGLDKLQIKASDEDIRTRMRFIDKDKSGHITFEEFNDWLLMLPEISPRAFFDHFYRTGRADPLQDALCHNMPSSHGAKLANVAADLFSGAVAGVVSRTVTAPIDRLRLLLQAAPPGTPSAGMAETVSKIIKEGGMKAFFRGNGVNCLKIAPETAFKFVVFDLCKAAVAADPHHVTALERFTAGGLAGALTQILIYPLEIVKTRLGLAEPGRYTGVGHCLSNIVRLEGWRALYTGLGTSIVGIIPYAAIDLGCNSLLKDIVCKRLEQKSSAPSVPVLLGCGMASASTAMLCTYPLNLVRTRLQAAAMNSGGGQPLAGPLDVCRHTFERDGFKGFYRGITPNMLKVLPATAISYTIMSLLSAQLKPA